MKTYISFLGRVDPIGALWHLPTGCLLVIRRNLGPPSTNLDPPDCWKCSWILLNTFLVPSISFFNLRICSRLCDDIVCNTISGISSKNPPPLRKNPPLFRNILGSVWEAPPGGENFGILTVKHRFSKVKSCFWSVKWQKFPPAAGYKTWKHQKQTSEARRRREKLGIWDRGIFGKNSPLISQHPTTRGGFLLEIPLIIPGTKRTIIPGLKIDCNPRSLLG